MYGNQQGQAAIGIGCPQITAAPAAPTLVRALSQVDELNKRLNVLSSQAYELASQLGGPYPVEADDGKAEATPESVLFVLNRRIDSAHQTVGAIEGAINAMRRSLGA